MTKRENYAKLREIVKGDAELVAFIDHELELLDKKNKAPKAPTTKQVENEKLKDVILAEIGEKKMTITEMTDTISALKDLSNQRVSAIVKQLVEDNSLVRTVDKRKAYFSKA